MIRVAHRGNISGSNSESENDPDHIREALAQGFHVEVDAWLKDGSFLLGHDGPRYAVDLSFFRNSRVWTHCKNTHAFIRLSRLPDANCFMQEADDVAMTSRGFLWTHSNCPFHGDRSILTRLGPFDGNLHTYGIGAPYGVCSDYPSTYDAPDEPPLPFRVLICDIDGVLNAGKSYDLEGKVVSKTWCDIDFTAIKRLKVAGIQICFLSGDRRVNEAMAKARKVDFIHSPHGTDKIDYLPEIIEKYGTNEIAYVGDDYFDIAIMSAVRMSFCPQTSPAPVRRAATHIVPVDAGKGVIAGLYDMVEDRIPYVFPKEAPRV